MSGFTLRISLIPAAIPEDQFFIIFGDFIDKCPGGGKITEQSFAPSATSADREKDPVATVTIDQVPQIFRKDGPIYLQWAGKNIKVSVDSSFIGLTPLSNPIQGIDIDIIAVTGLAGHAFGSWKARGASDMWLRDFLPAGIPGARILTYGYDSKVLYGESISSVFDFATRFLEALKTARVHEDEKHRPILFIAHSLGGLLVKQALVNAAHGSEEDKRIYTCCYGLVFFGVPNRGMTNDALMCMVKGQPNARLIKDLAPESRSLHKLNDDFSRIFTFEDSQVVSIFETKMTKAHVETSPGKWEKVGPACLIVHESSAIICERDGKCFDQFSIDADHSDITKFSTRSHQDFINVRHRILRLVQDAPGVIKKRCVLHRGPPGTQADCGISEGMLSILQRKRKSSTEELEASKKPTIDRGKILAWLSKLEPEDDRERIYAKMHENTGQWFLESTEVREWSTTRSPCALWCHGKPGAGKSVLTSILLREIISKHKSNEKIGIAFFYFNFQSETSQEPMKVLSILLKQLCRHKKDIPDSLNELYKKCADNDKTPRLAELQTELRGIIDSFEEVFLVIDAMDECNESYRKQFLPYIVKLFQESSGRLKVFVTSRPEKDIVRTFTSREFKTIKIEAKKVDEDIAKYVRHELENWQHYYCELDEDLSREIEKVLVSKSGGMFLWVKCQLDHLYQQPSTQDIRNALNSLPADMAATYLQILGRINRQPEVMKTIAIRALTWVITARRPLSPEELAVAVAIETKSTSVAEIKEKYKLQVAIDACCGLLSLERGFVRPVHFTVQEFLKGPEGFIGDDIEANYELARSSIRYMLCKQNTSYEQAFSYLHFNSRNDSHYIWLFWDYHTRYLPLPLSDDLKHLVLELFSSENFLIRYRKKIYSSVVSMLCLYTRFDLLQVYTNLYPLDSASADSDDLKEAARIAAKGGFVSSMTIVLDLIGPAGTKDDELLFLAVGGGHKEVVHLLLSRGADINACANRGTALYSAVAFNHLDIVKVLCENGADTNISKSFTSCLYPAANSHAHNQCGYGNNTYNTCQDNRIFVHTKECLKNQRIVEILLLHGADVHMKCGEYGTALQAAIVNSNEGVIGMLLEKGADPNIGAYRRGYALLALASQGKQTIFRALLKNGLDLSNIDWEYGSALGTAVGYDKETAVRTLLESGIDVNSKDTRGRTALQVAAHYNKDRMVRVLLENGADVNGKDNQNRTALKDAAYYSTEAIVKILLECGADVNGKDNWDHSILQDAVCEGNEAIVRILLANGADVNGKYTWNPTTLQGAVSYINEEIVTTALENGADLGFGGWENSTTLGTTANYGKETTATALLEDDASLSIKGGDYSTALQAAATEGKEVVAGTFDGTLTIGWGKWNDYSYLDKRLQY